MDNRSDVYENFHIVGIGASAGGLKAIQEFFDSIKNPKNVSFIIVQHLSPDFKSLMSDLLSSHTSLEITTVSHNQLIAPDHVYLVPSGKTLEIRAGRFILTKKDRSHTVHYPIDAFFNSLGKQYREKVIGIVLSGTGTDGSRGIKTIKEHEGMVIVQDPNESQFDGMPKSVLATGMADIIAPVDVIAEKVMSLVSKGRPNLIIDNHSENGAIDNNKIFNAILDQLSAKRSIDFKPYRKSSLLRRISKRLQLLNLSNLSEYHDYLIEDEKEAKILEKEFLVGVTQLFRDPEAFTYLKETVFPDLFYRKKESGEVRIWSAGCATGEEAYSLAIAIQEFITEHKLKRTFKVFATDLNENYLEKAGTGMFDKSIVGDISNSRLEKFFTIKSHGYQINKEVRNNIIFARHDILKTPPFINIDLISCRNLLIYLEKESKRLLLDKFNYCLNKNGYLFLGLNELIDFEENHFTSVNSKWSIYKSISENRNLSGRTLFNLALKRQSDGTYETSKSMKTVNVVEDSHPGPYARALLRHYAPVFILVNDETEVLYVSGDTESFLRFPQSKSEFKLDKMVTSKNLAMIKAGILKVRKNNKVFEYNEVPFSSNGKQQLADLRIIPLWFEDREERLFVIELANQKETDIEVVKESFDEKKFQEQQIRLLELRLFETERKLAESIKKYEKANEQLHTSNEELMSSNEEMQSTNEELQSVNEELFTVNTELQSKIQELININNDINNLLLSTEIGTIFLDNKLKIRKYTPEIEKLFNIQNPDIGRHIFNFTDNFNFGNYRNSLNKVLDTGTSAEFEVKNDSDHKSYLMKINPFINHKNILEGVVISFVDIDEMTRMKEEINHWFDLSVDLIYIADAHGNFKQVNPRIERILGKPKEHILQRSILEFIHPEDHLVTSEKWDELATSATTLHYENRLFSNDNEYRWISWSCQSTVDGTVYSIGRDITQDKKNYNNLKRSHEELEQFAYVATHDLRAPIVNLGSLVNIFQTLGYVNNQNEELFEKIKSSVSRINETLHDLIGIVALRKTIDQHIKKSVFSELFNYVIESIEEQVKIANGLINTDFSEVEFIDYNPGHIKSILQNLLTNSIKYRSPDRRLEIEVETHQKDGFVCLTVRDNGKGIAQSKHSQVFKLFRRFDESVEGKGIGLFAIKSQIESYGGKISFKSQLGKGSTFEVYLKPMKVSIVEEVN